MKRILIILSLLFMFPLTTLAYGECEFQDRERIQKLADNVTYVVVENTDEYGKFNGTFKIIFSGVSNELIFEDNLGHFYTNYEDYDFGEFFTYDMNQGIKYQTYIYGLNTCKFDKFRTITINLPTYNPYYDNPLCEDAKELSVCSKWGNVNISYDEFAKKVEEYKTTKNHSVIDNNNSANENWLYNLYHNYYWLGLSSMIIILGILIFFWIKEQQKNRL